MFKKFKFILLFLIVLTFSFYNNENKVFAGIGSEQNNGNSGSGTDGADGYAYKGRNSKIRWIENCISLNGGIIYA